MNDNNNASVAPETLVAQNTVGANSRNEIVQIGPNSYQQGLVQFNNVEVAGGMPSPESVKHAQDIGTTAVHQVGEVVPVEPSSEAIPEIATAL
ncbi:MAG: hypothetical protein NVS1B7_2400 [Candidatus Saccharimonadales bacterium]